MLRILVFLGGLALVAFGIAWIADRPGDIVFTWQGYHVETSVGVGLALLLIAAITIAVLWGVIRFLLRSPRLMRQRAAVRRRAKGLTALTRGMIAVGAGDARLAKKSAAEAGRHLDDEPLAHLLRAQAAQLSGDRAAAIEAFERLAKGAETRLLGLRGLHVEAQRRGDHEAAIHYAQEAHKIAPLPWSAKAVLEHRAAHSDWHGALAALNSQIAAKLVDKHTGQRQRAVLQTAIALDEAERAPDDALRLAREALAHAPDLVPASVLAARILAHKGEVRRAAKMIETAWSRQRHPELAETFLDLRTGDSNADRLAKAQTLAKFAPNDPESRMIVARAALAARDFGTARKAMVPLIAEGARPSVRACLIMAELEDAESGDQGQVREWLARSARAPRDPAWIADGVISKHWAPVSPVTGRLDAFVWQTPEERLGADLDADREALEWARHWALPRPRDGERYEAQPVIARAFVPEKIGPIIDAMPEPEARASSPDEEPEPQKAEPRLARPAQTVIFPMAGAPDDPGPDEEATDSDAIRRVGRV
jgi:HemY protein